MGKGEKLGLILKLEIAKTDFWKFPELFLVGSKIIRPFYYIKSFTKTIIGIENPLKSDIFRSFKVYLLLQYLTKYGHFTSKLLTNFYGERLDGTIKEKQLKN